MVEQKCCIIPTGRVRILRMNVAIQNAPEKLQMEFTDYDGTQLIWRDVPIFYTDVDTFRMNEHIS